MPSARSMERLEVLGIDVWVRRDRQAAVRNAAAPEPRPAAGGQSVPRVRMASGDGDWLLVQDAPWDGRHDTLLGDIQAAIGSARCRFGQWAHSESAGVPVDELGSRGVRHVLVFGQAPEGAANAGVIIAPELPELSRSGTARRRLWRALAGEVGD